MHCSKASRLLQLYIDKRLPLHTLRSLEVHVSTCQACRQEIRMLEEIEQAFQSMDVVAEPDDLVVNVMQRISISEQRKKLVLEQQLVEEKMRPSLREMVYAFLLSTFAMLGILLPAFHTVLPVANGHDTLSVIWTNFWNMLLSINSSTLLLGFWIFGTMLGVWITLVLAGAEMRSQWYRAVMQRLPVR